MREPDPLSTVPGSPGLWRQINSDASPAATPRPAIFLDRDGVVVAETNYLHRIEDMEVLSGAAETIRLCNASRIPVILVTNQSGVGRGYYGWPEFAAIQEALSRHLATADAHFDMVLACAYHAEGKPPYDRAGHAWRKPGPGMIHDAATALNLDLARSWIIGDSASDIEAGKNAGLAGGIHLLSGHGTRDREKSLTFADAGFNVIVEPGIGAAGHIHARLVT